MRAVKYVLLMVLVAALGAMCFLFCMTARPQSPTHIDDLRCIAAWGLLREGEDELGDAGKRLLMDAVSGPDCRVTSLAGAEGRLGQMVERRLDRLRRQYPEDWLRRLVAMRAILLRRVEHGAYPAVPELSELMSICISSEVTHLDRVDGMVVMRVGPEGQTIETWLP